MSVDGLEIPELINCVQVKKENDILNFVTSTSDLTFDKEVKYYMLKTPYGWKFIRPDNWIIKSYEYRDGHVYYVFTNKEFNDYYKMDKK